MKTVLVLGASGYVGARLVPRLLEAGWRVRCLARDPRKLDGRPWAGAETVRGDALDAASLLRAAEGCDAMYYLVHSMAAGEKSFEELDLKAARNAANAAAQAGLKRIVYLGGLGERSADLSPHLRSRNEVGRVLAEGPVPVTEFRAAMIIGSGSLSFDMMHALVNRLPVMTAPRWVSTRSQPIGIRDVIRYLVECLRVQASAGKVIDIGGPDIVTYKEMMTMLARLLGLRRWIITVPVLTPRLSSLWINLVTPISASIARPLIEGLRSEMICTTTLAADLFPFQPIGFEEALTLALRRMRDSGVESRWTDASVGLWAAGEAPAEEPLTVSDTQELHVRATPADVFAVFSSIGGENGWFYANTLWRLRGFLDKMIGGVGLRRGRRHPERLLPGEALDFWRVEEVRANERLRLRAEMKLPGRAWLEFSVCAADGNGSRFTQRATFYPSGLVGLLYWYGVYPLHVLVFRGMARAIARRSESVSSRRREVVGSTVAGV